MRSACSGVIGVNASAFCLTHCPHMSTEVTRSAYRRSTNSFGSAWVAHKGKNNRAYAVALKEEPRTRRGFFLEPRVGLEPTTY